MIAKMITSSTNPYDFERPVKDPTLFAGRQKELSEIGYYLDLSRQDRPIFHNMALIGPRGVGKTSMLNMVAHLCEERGILAVKVSLNDEAVANEVILFKEIFDNLLTKGVESGMYEGLGGQTYRLFRKLVDNLDVSVQIPFYFGTAYIGAKKGEKVNLSQQVLLHDFKEFYEEAKKKGIVAIALLFDECDLFSTNRTLLQKLRNVFSELDGFVLVFSGTNKMFPDMEEVFSPVPRFFKRIDIGNFNSLDETKDCILKPLGDSEKALVDLNSVIDVHLISNGNPYEIQLMSHYMYRRFKESKLPTLSLDVRVLDNILGELERLRRGGHHEIADKVKQVLLPETLRAVLSALECPGANIDELSRLLVLKKIYSHELKDIASLVESYRFEIRQCIGLGILKQQNDGIFFSGDYFDVLYLKYFAFSREIKDFSFGAPNDTLSTFARFFSEVLLRDVKEFESTTKLDGLETLEALGGVSGQRVLFGRKGIPAVVDPITKLATYTFSLVPSEMDQRFYLGSSDALRFRVNLEFHGGEGFVIQVRLKNDEDLLLVKNRVQKLNIKLQFIGLKILPKDEIDFNLEGIKEKTNRNYAAAIIAFDKGIALNPNFELLWANKGGVFFETGRFEEALMCFEKWRDLKPREGLAWGRIGEALINLHRCEESISALKKASEFSPQLSTVWDNLGRAYFYLGNFKEAIPFLDRAIDLEQKSPGALVFKAMSLFNLGQIDEAEKLYDLVLTYEDRNLDALIGKGIVLANRGNIKSAIDFFRKSLNLAPNNTFTLMNLALALSKEGNHEEAIETCSRILELDNNNALALFNRACFLTVLGSKSQALDDLEKAVQLDENLKSAAKSESDFDSIREDTRFTKITCDDLLRS